MSNEELIKELDTAKRALDVLWDSKDSLATERDQLQTALRLADSHSLKDKARIAQLTANSAKLRASLTILEARDEKWQQTCNSLTRERDKATAKERNQLKAELASMTKDRDQRLNMASWLFANPNKPLPRII